MSYILLCSTLPQKVYSYNTLSLPSLDNLSFAVPAVQVYTAGSNRGTVVVTLTSGFVNASLFCIPENEYVSVIWFVYDYTSLLEQELQNGSYVVERNGHNLVAQHIPLMDFLMTLFECRLLGSFSGMDIPIVNFTTVGIPGSYYTNAAMNGLSL